MLGFIRQGLEDFSISRARARPGASRSRSARTAQTSQREDGSWDPEAGTIYVWYDALINYITGAGLPGRPGRVRALVAGRPPRHRQGHRPLPHHLLAGDAVECRPRGAAHRSGSTAGCSRPGRRADEQEPRQLPRSRTTVVAAFGADGARYVTLREVAVRPRHRGRPGTRSSVATTRTSPTTSATSSTARSRWPIATSTASGRRRVRPREPRRWPWAGRTRCA